MPTEYNNKSAAPGSKKDEEEHLTGAQKAGVLFLAIGPEKSAPIIKKLAPDEVGDISTAIGKLGLVNASTVEHVCEDFSNNFGTDSGVIGNYTTMADFLKKTLPANRVDQILEEIGGPTGKTMWDKLGNVQETVLANYLRNEYPQTTALIMTHLKPEPASRVLALLPEDYATDVMMRMLHIETVQPEVLSTVENTLRSEFVSSLGRSSKGDNYELLAEIFNNFDRSTEKRMISSLDERNHDDTEKVKSLMFTFEDIKRLTHADLMRIVTQIDREKLPLALKGASRTVRDMFLQCMSKRAGGILSEEIESLGPIRVKDADSAQQSIVNTIKDMAASGEVDLNESDNDEIIP